MSLAARSALFICFAAVGTLALIGMLLMPDPYPWILIAGAVALILAWTVPLSWAVFGWAALLPIWSLGPLPPVVLDVARTVLGGVIFIRAMSAKAEPNRALKPWAVPIVVVATLLTVLSFWRGESVTGGVFQMASVLVVSAALWRLPSMWPVLVGFAVGASISGAVVVMSALGVGAVSLLVPNSDPGFYRYTGLGTSAPRVSTEFAAAAVIWWCALSGRVCRTLVGMAGIAVSLIALMLCGGRTGLLGLGLALALIVVRRWLRPALAISLAAAVGAAAYWLSGRSVAFNTLDRLAMSSTASGGLTTGRLALIPEAWEEFLRSPVFGPGASDFVARYGAVPHFPPLSYAVTGGVVAAGIVLFLTFRLLTLTAANRGRSTSPLQRVGCLLAAVLVAPALLEPDGPYLGVEMLTLLFAAVVAASTPGSDGDLRPLVGVGGVLAADVELVSHAGRALHDHDLAAQPRARGR